MNPITRIMMYVYDTIAGLQVAMGVEFLARARRGNRPAPFRGRRLLAAALRAGN